MNYKLSLIHPLSRICTIALALLLLSLFNTSRIAWAQGDIIYVDDNVLGNNDGTSWRNAFNKLQDALAQAQSGDQIWVAAGVYYPDEGVGILDNSPFATFTLKSGVPVYGGFAGTERRLAQRDFVTNVTVLSGDIAQDDLVSNDFVVFTESNLVGENSVSVVTASGVDSSGRLDGFFVTGGMATKNNAYCSLGACGGGLFGENSSIALANITFTGNRATYGGGVYFYGYSTPTLTDISFRQNGALSFGGGAQIQAGAIAELTRVQFIGNTAQQAGGGSMVYGATATFQEATFQINSAFPNGGGLYNWGGEVIIKNSIFGQNYAEDSGGGIFSDSGTLYLEEVQFTENRNEVNTGGGIYSQESALTLIGVDFVGNKASYTGGALSVRNSEASTTLIDVTMVSNGTTDNQGGWAGAFWQSGGNLRMANVTISRNSTFNLGGGVVLDDVDTKMTNVALMGNVAVAVEGDISYGGGMEVAGGSLVASNLLFVGNRGTINGALHVSDIDAELYSATFAANVATVTDTNTQTGQAIFVENGSLKLNNSIIMGEATAPLIATSEAEFNARYSLFQAVDDIGDTNNNLFTFISPFQTEPNGGIDGFGNDPNTLEDESADDDYGNLRLNLTSIAIDAGSSDDLPLDVADVNSNEDTTERLPLDLDNTPRIARYYAETARVDMGAYELQNAEPVAVLDGIYRLDEGGFIELDATASSDDMEIVNYAWDCTDDGTVDVSETSPLSGICEYPDSGTYTLRLTVTDNMGATGTATTNVTVSAFSPVFIAAENQSAVSGRAKQFNLGSFTNSGTEPGTDEEWSIDVNWGDDYSSQFTTISVGELSPLLHTYMESGTYTVVITLDNGDIEYTDSFEVKVSSSSAPPPPPPASSAPPAIRP